LRCVPPSSAARCAACPRASPAALRASATDSGLRLERVRAFAGRRAVHQVSWVRAPHAHGLREVDFTVTSLYAALAARGVAVARATETIRPGILDAALAVHSTTHRVLPCSLATGPRTRWTGLRSSPTG
jgi:DNA-binding GntR family transcriptional regulator